MIGYDNQFNRITPNIRHLGNEVRQYRWKPDRELTLTKVPNTIISCRLCRGSRFGDGVVANRYQDGTIDLIPCPNCDGTKIQKSDHIDTLWGRNR